MTRHISRFSVCIMAILLVSCGKQHKAENVVKEFLDENLVTDDYSVSFSKIDSTRHVTDSMITVMQSAAARNRIFKKDIKYDTSSKTGKYIFTQTKIYKGKDTISNTFYLDTDLTHVIAFKEN